MTINELDIPEADNMLSDIQTAASYARTKQDEIPSQDYNKAMDAETVANLYKSGDGRVDIEDLIEAWINAKYVTEKY